MRPLPCVYPLLYSRASTLPTSLLSLRASSPVPRASLSLSLSYFTGKSYCNNLSRLFSFVRRDSQMPKKRFRVSLHAASKNIFGRKTHHFQFITKKYLSTDKLTLPLSSPRLPIFPSRPRTFNKSRPSYCHPERGKRKREKGEKKKEKDPPLPPLSSRKQELESIGKEQQGRDSEFPIPEER